jgi:hypothetical protein
MAIIIVDDRTQRKATINHQPSKSINGRKISAMDLTIGKNNKRGIANEATINQKEWSAMVKAKE